MSFRKCSYIPHGMVWAGPLDLQHCSDCEHIKALKEKFALYGKISGDTSIAKFIEYYEEEEDENG